MRGRGSLVLALLLAVAGVVLWLVLGGETERARVDGPSVTEQRDDATAGDVELAGGSERPAIDGGGARSEREVVEDAPAPGGLVWADLFAPIDFATRVPIADWEVRIATPDGEVLVRAADEAVRAGDLAAKRIGAIDAGGSCPRFFRAEDVAAWLDERRAAAAMDARDDDVEDLGSDADAAAALAPRPVSLCPSGTATVRFESDDPGLGPSEADAVQVILGTAGDAEAVDPRLLAAPVPDEGVLRRLLDLQGTARRVLDRDDEGVERAAMLDSLARGTGLAPLFDLDGPPLVAGLVHRAVRGFDDEPAIVDDLPLGFDAVAMALDAPGLEISVDGGASWSEGFSNFFRIDAAPEALVLVRATNPARVIGELPSDAAGAYHVLYDADADLRLPLHLAVVSSGGLRPGAPFAIEPVRPGSYRIEVRWRVRGGADDGARAAVVRHFEVGPGDEHDLGSLVASGARVTVVPSFEIDGVLDPTALDGALEPMQWSVGVTAVERGDPAMNGSWFGVSTSGLEPVTLLGVPPGPCELSVSQDSPLIDGDPSVRFVRWRYESEFDAFGDVRVDAVLEASRTTAVRIDLIVPGGPLDLCAADGAAAVRADGEQLLGLYSGGARWDEEAGEWRWTIESALPPGAWTITAAALTEFQGDAPPPSGPVAGWVGAFELEVPAVGEVPEARFVLERGAAVTGTARAFNGDLADDDSFVALVPEGDPPSARRQLWRWLARDADAEGTFWNLLPNTTYRVEASGRTFTTGGPGSVLELDEEDER